MTRPKAQCALNCFECPYDDCIASTHVMDGKQDRSEYFHQNYMNRREKVLEYHKNRKATKNGQQRIAT